MFGRTMPTWLLREGSVLLRRHVRSTSDPLCVEVLLLEAHPSYAHVRYSNGHEDTVSMSDLAPCPDIGIELSTPPVSTPEDGNAGTSCDVRPPTEPDTATRQLEHPAVPSCVEPQLPLAVPPLRRSSTSRRCSEVLHRSNVIVIATSPVCILSFITFVTNHGVKSASNNLVPKWQTLFIVLKSIQNFSIF